MLRGIVLSAIAGATLAAAVQVARPQEAPKDSLTVDEALTVLQGLSRLSGPQEPGPDGKPTYFQLSPDTRILIASDIDIGKRATAASQSAINDVKMELMVDGVFPKERQELFLLRVAKIGQAKSMAVYHRIRTADLCLRVKEPDCKAANNIPADVLSMLWPILDDK